ncbi:hypothetical protein ES731_07850 [Psychroflexus gondwanensis]|jgi:hypothetical protein|uniref:Branched-chain amino acid permease BrnQ-like protein n=1 Tax=Psychroflexus gondwanensis ACAM 44 TaxID=1189619 RepID=N1WKE8_9FLAO|nr:hypothetical protein [Psychroflexus gondwanensis]EMY80711.1 branched-chain amino acid permease BrnQ-like protein [Psychroflexus gondwanensis ACAM 44]TXE19508.1 hypothetical protein ES731_07850 [Psychroflexus gondwanensis]
MNKIFNIIKIVFGVVGAILFIRILNAGDEAIEADAALQTSVLAPFMWVSYIILGVTVLAVLFFAIKALFTGNIKKTLLSLGGFILVIVISYAVSSGTETAMRDGDILSANGSRWVSAGLVAFYILAALAVLAMFLSSVRKIINK